MMLAFIVKKVLAPTYLLWTYLTAHAELQILCKTGLHTFDYVLLSTLLCFSIACFSTTTYLIYVNYSYIFRVFFQDITNYRDFTVLYEDSWILLNQTTTQLDAHAAQVLHFAVWSYFICCFLINYPMLISSIAICLSIAIYDYNWLHR